jgi:hypothetical protein
MESLLFYGGLVLAAIGLLCVARPIALIGVSTRKRAALLFLAGGLLAGVGLLLPVRSWPIAQERGRLDDFMPTAQFGERHSIRIHAPRSKVYHALRATTADEIRLFQLLTWIRSPRLPWRKTQESILAPSPDDPILDVALRSGFLLLAEQPAKEIVLGTVVCCRQASISTVSDFVRLDGPGYAKAAINFRLQDAGPDETLLTTETRVAATDAGAKRRFAVYWRVIYPGSALIRRMWLRAVKQRAERT